MHSTQLVVRVPTNLAEAFARAAERQERTVSAEVRLAMREHLAELESRERFDRMTREELDEYLTGVDDGAEERAQARADGQDDERAARHAARRPEPAAGAAEHGPAT